MEKEKKQTVDCPICRKDLDLAECQVVNGAEHKNSLEAYAKREPQEARFELYKRGTGEAPVAPPIEGLPDPSLINSPANDLVVREALPGISEAPQGDAPIPIQPV